MDFEYVREHYGVPAEIGRIVTINGKQGIIAADRGHYIGVNFDLDNPGVIHNVHPTWEVIYGELGKVRKLTSAQRRYQDYLDVADCYESFAAFLGVKKKCWWEAKNQDRKTIQQEKG